MSQNSSISSSSARRYLGVALAAALAGVAAIAATSLFAMRGGYADWQFAQLYRYQLGKLAAMPAGGVVLLGDSSLGNAIAAKDWSDTTGVPVTSLALTGEYGYAGALNMLRRALRKGRPKAVVLVFAVDAFARKVSHRGLVYTSETLADLAGAPMATVLASLVDLGVAWQGLRAMVLGTPPPEPAMVEHDYVPQRPRLTREQLMHENIRDLRPETVNAAKVRYLAEIAALCKAEGFPCFYMHGPYLGALCAGAQSYLETVNRLIEKAGLSVVYGTPACFPVRHIGDSVDHVYPVYKYRYGLYHLQLLQRYLAPAG